MFSEKHPVNDDEDTDQEHEDGYPVNPVHILDPGTGRFIRISFYDIKVFPDFS